MSKLRAEHLLPLACAGACAVLAASEFMNVFKLNGPGPAPQAVQTAAHRHHYALLVLAGFALIALVIAVIAGSKPAAIAVAICGVGALLIFLLRDLPDAGKVGTISDFTQAKAVPQPGFWLELTGALVLAICGAALATLSPDQLRAFARSTSANRGRWTSGGGRQSTPAPRPASPNPGEDDVNPTPGNKTEARAAPKSP